MPGKKLTQLRLATRKQQGMLLAGQVVLFEV